MSSPPDAPADPPVDAPSDADGASHPTDSTLEAAQHRLRVERRILGDERTAFRVFADRLEGARAPLSTATVASHYRETVMSVPHYHVEYGDTLGQSIAAEFGERLARDVRERTELDRATIDALRAAAARCRRDRDRLVDRIDAERHSLARARERLAAIREECDALESAPDHRRRLQFAALRERCDEVADRRRGHLSARAERSDGDPGFQLQSFLYRDCATERPVLAAVAATRRAIDDRRQQLLGKAGR